MWAHYTTIDTHGSALFGDYGTVSYPRPDFTDPLTVQALYLLVVRAWHAAGCTVRVHAANGHVHLTASTLTDPDAPTWRTKTGLGTRPAPHVKHYGSGPAYAVFACALAAAPTK